MLNKNAFLPSLYKFFMVLFAFCLLAVHSVEPYERRTPVVEAVQKVLPTVVNISTRSTKQITVYRQTPFGELFNHPFSPLVSPFGERETYQVESVGSGVVVENGYIVTNNHVIASDTGSAIHVADEIFVTLYEDQKQHKAKVVGADPRADIAILKIDASPSKYLPWGRSDDLMIGETVIGIGNALGQPFTVTSGIISALNRSITTENDMRLFNLIQTDADINRGNSGGPLVNINGKFIGLNTVIISPSGGSVGVGFAIPVLRVKNIYDYWIHNILSVEDQMGLEIQEMDTYLEHHFRRFYPNLQNEKLKGVVVLEVSPGGLCDGKLQSADIIHHVDEKTVESISDLRSILEEHSG
ncbi:trypsin-like serine protease, partial [bacterium]|nr:trypsin-like serine protease [bacterium]